MKDKSSKAIVLLSGGLDSMLAVKVLQRQGVLVVGVSFSCPFYSAEKAEKAAENLGIRLIVKDISEEMLGLVKNPPSGYGKRMNPCIDCHTLMIKTASEIAKEENADFIASGEVLDQRPFSQTKESLARIINLSGIDIVRPLSAKLLPETEAEKSGKVDRHRLLDISGRSRSRQEELARNFEMNDYPSPAGGCLLTDPGYSERLIILLDNWPDMTVNDTEVIKRGRVFWFNADNGGKIMLVIGRHEEDNNYLEKLAIRGDIMVKLKDENGPTTIIRGVKGSDINEEKEIDIPENIKLSEVNVAEEKSINEIVDVACLLTGYYAVKARGKRCLVGVDAVEDV
jgi:tRNA-uridine 2-sulfurtransferase